MSIQALNAVLEHDAVTAGATRLILLSLANHADERLECWPSKARICREANVSESTLKRSMAELESLGIVRRVVQAAPDARMRPDRRTNLYRLTLNGGVKLGEPRNERGGQDEPNGGVKLTQTGGSGRPPYPSLEPSQNRGHVREASPAHADLRYQERYREIGDTLADLPPIPGVDYDEPDDGGGVERFAVPPPIDIRAGIRPKRAS